MAESLMDLRRINANMTFRLGDAPTLAGLLSLAEDVNEASFLADPQIAEARLNEGLADIAQTRFPQAQCSWPTALQSKPAL